MGELTKTFVGGWDPVEVPIEGIEAAKTAFANFYRYSEEIRSSEWRARCILALGTPSLVVLPQSRWDTTSAEYVRSALAEKIIEGLKRAFPLGDVRVGASTSSTSVVVYSPAAVGTVVEFLGTLIGEGRRVVNNGGKITFPKK